MRAALGAGRRRLYAQLLTESVLLAVLGGVLGIALALGLLDVIVATLPPYTLPSEADVRLSIPVLVFTLGATTLAGVLFGCAPAWQASRLNLAETLKEGGRSAASGRHRLRRGLVMVEFGLALALLAGGGLAIHSFLKLVRLDLGFRTERLLVFDLPVPETRLRDPDAVRAFYRRLLERVEAVPGVTAATVSTGVPGWGTNFGGPFEVVGQPLPEGSAFRGAGFNMVSPRYYETFGIRMLSGRPLTAEDAERAAPVAVVNETFARRYLAGLDPLAQQVSVSLPAPGLATPGPRVVWQIVGVTRDVRNGGPRNESFPQLDMPFWQSPWPAAQVSVRTAVEPASLVPSLAAIVQSLDPDLPLANPRTLDEIVSRGLARDRFNALLFGGFAATALILAALGIYGVMSFVVAQRRQELGLRLALGASRSRVLGMILKDGMTTALGGTLRRLPGRLLGGPFDAGDVPGRSQPRPDDVRLQWRSCSSRPPYSRAMSRRGAPPGSIRWSRCGRSSPAPRVASLAPPARLRCRRRRYPGSRHRSQRGHLRSGGRRAASSAPVPEAGTTGHGLGHPRSPGAGPRTPLARELPRLGGDDPGVPGHGCLAGRLGSVDAAPRGGPGGGRDGEGDAGLLSGAWGARGSRTHLRNVWRRVVQRRRSLRDRRPRSRDEPPAVDEPLRRGPRARGPGHSARRRSLDGRRDHAARLRPSAAEHGALAGLGHRSELCRLRWRPAARLPFPERPGAPATGSVARGSAGRGAGARGHSRRSASESQCGMERPRRLPRGRARGAGTAGRPAPRRRCGPRVAPGLRERGQPAARPGDRAPSRDRRAPVARGLPPSGGAPAPRREPATGAAGRRRRPGRGARAVRRDPRGPARGLSGARGSLARRARGGLCHARGDCERDALRPGAGSRGLGCADARGAERRRTRGDARPSRAARPAPAHRRPGRGGSRAAHRGGSRREKLRPRPVGGPGLRSAGPAHLAHHPRSGVLQREAPKPASSIAFSCRGCVGLRA